MDSNIRTINIYVRLLNEGTEVFRPTRALERGDDVLTLIATDDYDPEIEEWEFPPNSVVRSEWRRDGDSEYLVAVAP